MKTFICPWVLKDSTVQLIHMYGCVHIAHVVSQFVRVCCVAKIAKRNKMNKLFQTEFFSLHAFQNANIEGYSTHQHKLVKTSQ